MPRKKPVDPELQRLGTSLRDARERAGLTQRAAEQALDKSENYLSAIERGQVAPSILVVHRLAELYRTSIDTLVTGEPVASQRIDGELLGRIMQVIARLYREAGVTISELELGRLAAEEQNAAAAATPNEWPTVLKLVEARHRERLAADTPAKRTRRGA